MPHIPVPTATGHQAAGNTPPPAGSFEGPLTAVLLSLALVITSFIFALLKLSLFPDLRLWALLAWAALNWFLYLGFLRLLIWSKPGRAFTGPRNQRFRALVRQLLLAIVAIPLHAGLVLGLTTAVARLVHGPAILQHTTPGRPFLLLSQLLLDVLVYGILVTWRVISALQTERFQVVQFQAEASAKRLQFLRTQLQPHFLFNVLHSISALQFINLAAAQRTIVLLGDFLRSVLRFPDTELITVEEEVGYLRCYLAIEEVRLQDRLRVHFDLAPDVLGAEMPPLLFQPLVENAIRHAIAPFDKLGTIAVKVQHQGNLLVMEVLDNGPGLEHPDDPDPLPGGHGIGLANIKARLGELYPNDFNFTLESRSEGGVTARITIPFHLASGWNEQAIESGNDSTLR